MTTRSSIPELVSQFRLGWKRFAWAAGAVFAAAWIYALLAPKWYAAQLSVVPVTSKGGNVPQLLGAVGGIASAALDLPLDLGLGGNEIDRIAAVFRSNSVTDKVIEKFGLMQRYQESFIEDTRRTVWEHCNVRIDKKPGVVALTCEDKSPEVARDIVAFFGSYGNEVFRRVSLSSASEERIFLEERVAEARKELDEAARDLREFQEQNHIVDISEQSKAVISAMAKIKADLLAKQMQLSYVDSFSGSDEATAQQLGQQIAVLEGKLHHLEDSPETIDDEAEPPAVQRAGKKRAPKSVFPAAMAVPKLRYQYEHLYREQKIQEAVFLMLTQRFEGAKVNEARDTPVFQILDQPVLPTKKARPKRSIVVILGFFLALVAGAGAVLLPPWWRQYARALRAGG